MKYFIEFNDSDNLTFYFDDKYEMLNLLSYIIDLELPENFKITDFGKCY